MRMSCSFVFNLFLLRSTTAFAPAARSPWTTTAAAARASGTALRATASENWQIRLMEAYEEAEAAVEKHGVMSPEARLAWEEVDDLELLPSSVTAELPKPLDEECDVMTDEQKCREFEYAMKKLDELADGAQTINYQIKYHTEKLQNLKMSSGAKRDLAIKKRGSSAYQAAMADAEAANEKFGKDSAEARVAWAEVFEIVASEGKNDRAAKPSLEEVCVIDGTSAACKDYANKMAQLQKAIATSED